MKLATFTHDATTRIGVVIHDTADGSPEIVDLATAAPELPTEMTALLEEGTAALARAAEAARSASTRIPVAQVHLEPPVLRPPKFLAIALNYADHVAESGRERPEVPVFFNKQSTCVIGAHDPIHVPRVSDKVDYEGELGVVIARRCRHVPRERAAEVIAGFLCVNDVSTRDWQFRSPTMTLGKSFDSHGPCGPWLVTADEIGDPHALEIKTWVNGDLRQSSRTDRMLYDCFEQIAHLSTVCTLEPGDIIATGTPAGVGAARKPPSFLTPGDKVRVEIERIGAIENPVVAEPDDTDRC